MRRARPFWFVAIAALVGGMVALGERGERSPTSAAREGGQRTGDNEAATAHRTRTASTPSRSGIDDTGLRAAIADRASDRWVQGAGIVERILPDDRRGSRHQRFVLRLDDGATLLIAHNIDLAPRIETLREGDRVEFHGEFEWNERGGVVHWTHDDPQGRRDGGWLRHAGRIYR